MAYAAVFFLLEQIIHKSVFGIEIGIDIQLADVVEHIKVEVFNLTALQLLLEYLFYLAHVF